MKIAEPRPDMNILVAAFTVNEKSSNLLKYRSLKGDNLLISSVKLGKIYLKVSNRGLPFSPKLRFKKGKSYNF